jgi:hypothetical protein
VSNAHKEKKMKKSYFIKAYENDDVEGFYVVDENGLQVSGVMSYEKACETVKQYYDEEKKQ